MTDFRIRDVSSSEIDQAVRDMAVQGYGRFPDLLSEQAIDEARRYVLDELSKHSGEYFSYAGADAVRGSLLAELGASSTFRDLFVQIYQRGLGRTAPETLLFQVLRVLSGQTGLKRAYQFHYDAFVVTALVPIAIPSGPGEKRGDLIIYPQLRNIRSNVLFNVLEKGLLQNPLARRMARSSLMQRSFKSTVLRMRPRDVYFFWGYQSLHGNEPCLVTSVRATALFHYADPHEGNFVTKTIRAIRIRREGLTRERVKGY
jgi:hypothetical protein